MPDLPLSFRLDPALATPIYAQIVEQVRFQIARGTLQPGDELPSVRALSGRHLINPNTVARAYTILEQAGLVTTKTGSGTFVSDPKLRSRDAADINALTERIDTLVTRGLNLGFDSNELISIFKDRLAAFANKPESRKI